MSVSLVKRTIIESPLYFDEESVNYIAVSSQDEALSTAHRLEIHSKDGIFTFETVTWPTLRPDAVALNSRQRKKYHLKKYKTYSVQPCESEKKCRSLADIINESFDFRSKVGGIEHVVEEIFGNVLLPRFYPRSFVDKIGIKKTRGILLSGPPGTGKTLIARTICELLNVQPKVVRGPEIFSCMLGESERKIRQLFDDARHDQQVFGPDSRLHVIIFDEIDALCRKRSSTGLSSDAVHDNVTTQLLAEIDGMIQLDNILLIGTTNLLETIDSALLRPGRIEAVIKIELPNATARSSIFDIHTNALLKNNAINRDVDIAYIIRRTAGMSGADIERTIRLAVQAAMRRDIINRNRFEITCEEGDQLEVRNCDFLKALEMVTR